MRKRNLATAAGLIGLAWSGVAAQDAAIYGCNQRDPGEVGVRELRGAVGDTVGVPVTVHTTAVVDAFALDVSFPTHLLTHIRTDPGDLLHPGWTFSGNFISADGVVRIGGFDPTPIPAGAVGQLAVVVFEVAQAGVDSFSTGDYLDDLTGYVACEQVNPPSAITGTAWSLVKALYR